MNSQPSLAQHLESFFHRRLTQQRNATPATVRAYRDALRLLILFASERTGKKPFTSPRPSSTRSLMPRT